MLAFPNSKNDLGDPYAGETPEASLEGFPV